MGKDILFIHPGNQKRVYQELSNEFTAIATPVWTSLLAERVRTRGYEAAVYDVNVNGWDDRVPSELISKLEPSVIVIMVYGHTPSSSTQTMPAARMIAGDIKRFSPDAVLAFGGIHPSALPELTLKQEPVDFVIRGEGCGTIEGLVELVKGRVSRSNVPGLAWLENGEYHEGPPSLPVSNLDEELPGYAWDMLPSFDRYRAHNMHCFQLFEQSTRDDFSDVRSPYVTMNTSLGCPFSCTYCCINSIFGKPGIRYWSVDKVLGWIDHIHAMGVRNIRLDDELFVLNPDRVEKICDGLIDRNYGLNIWVYGRVDTVKGRLLGKLRKAGFTWICLGIESGSAAVREGVNKRIGGSIEGLVKEIRDNGIFVLGNYMFGLPDDNLETMKQTLDFSMKLNCEFANFYVVMPYPGSDLFDQALERNEVDLDWRKYSQHGYETLPMATRHLTPAEVLKFRDEAFMIYHDNPDYMRMVRRTFGARVEAHLHKMLDIKIKRRLTDTQGKV